MPFFTLPPALAATTPGLTQTNQMRTRLEELNTKITVLENSGAKIKALLTAIKLPGDKVTEVNGAINNPTHLQTIDTTIKPFELKIKLLEILNTAVKDIAATPDSAASNPEKEAHESIQKEIEKIGEKIKGTDPKEADITKEIEKLTEKASLITLPKKTRELSIALALEHFPDNTQFDENTYPELTEAIGAYNKALTKFHDDMFGIHRSLEKSLTHPETVTKNEREAFVQRLEKLGKRKEVLDKFQTELQFAYESAKTFHALADANLYEPVGAREHIPAAFQANTTAAKTAYEAHVANIKTAMAQLDAPDSMTPLLTTANGKQAAVTTALETLNKTNAQLATLFAGDDNLSTLPSKGEIESLYNEIALNEAAVVTADGGADPAPAAPIDRTALKTAFNTANTTANTDYDTFNTRRAALVNTDGATLERVLAEKEQELADKNTSLNQITAALRAAVKAAALVDIALTGGWLKLLNGERISMVVPPTNFDSMPIKNIESISYNSGIGLSTVPTAVETFNALQKQYKEILAQHNEIQTQRDAANTAAEVTRTPATVTAARQAQRRLAAFDITQLIKTSYPGETIAVRNERNKIIVKYHDYYVTATNPTQTLEQRTTAIEKMRAMATLGELLAQVENPAAHSILHGQETLQTKLKTDIKSALDQLTSDNVDMPLFRTQLAALRENIVIASRVVNAPTAEQIQTATRQQANQSKYVQFRALLTSIQDLDPNFTIENQYHFLASQEGINVQHLFVGKYNLLLDDKVTEHLSLEAINNLSEDDTQTLFRSVEALRQHYAETTLNKAKEYCDPFYYENNVLDNRDAIIAVLKTDLDSGSISPLHADYLENASNKQGKIIDQNQASLKENADLVTQLRGVTDPQRYAQAQNQITALLKIQKKLIEQNKNLRNLVRKIHIDLGELRSAATGFEPAKYREIPPLVAGATLGPEIAPTSAEWSKITTAGSTATETKNEPLPFLGDEASHNCKYYALPKSLIDKLTSRTYQLAAKTKAIAIVEPIKTTINGVEQTSFSTFIPVDAIPLPTTAAERMDYARIAKYNVEALLISDKIKAGQPLHLRPINASCLYAQLAAALEQGVPLNKIDVKACNPEFAETLKNLGIEQDKPLTQDAVQKIAQVALEELKPSVFKGWFGSKSAENLPRKMKQLDEIFIDKKAAATRDALGINLLAGTEDESPRGGAAPAA
jgi:hypothetical protein